MFGVFFKLFLRIEFVFIVYRNVIVCYIGIYFFSVICSKFDFKLLGLWYDGMMEDV